MTIKTNQLYSKEQEYARRNALAQLVCYQLDELFEKLEVNLRRSGKVYIGCCPIHGGDNYSAINLYPEEYGTAPCGFWKCNTHKCHWIFKSTIIGFVRGVLSAKFFNWSEDKPQENMASFKQVITWLCKFVNQSWENIKVDEETVERQNFAAQVELFKKHAIKTPGVSRQNVRANLEIPANYYIERGYRKETLDTFDVGICTNPKKEMYNRAVVPVYEETGKLAVAFTGRSIFEKCEHCKLYHGIGLKCPDKTDRYNYVKWHHAGNTGNYLYNWWNAKRHVKEKNHIVLVEGPGDVWRLWEAGVQNVVATFGANLTDPQEILLEKSGAMRVTIIRDNDAAGEMEEANLKERLRYYRTKFIVPSKAKDVGEMSVTDIQQEIVPCLK